jgi:hypothetical protein
MSIDTRDWAERVAELYSRLLTIDTERTSILEQLANLRAGAGPSVEPDSGNKPKRPSPADDEPTIPKKGVAQDVYNHILASPGIEFTTEAMTTALGLDDTKKPVVTTALSRLFRSGLLKRPKIGVYVLPAQNQDEQPHTQVNLGGAATQID